MNTIYITIKSPEFRGAHHAFLAREVCYRLGLIGYGFKKKNGDMLLIASNIPYSSAKEAVNKVFGKHAPTGFVSVSISEVEAACQIRWSRMCANAKNAEQHEEEMRGK